MKDSTKSKIEEAKEGIGCLFVLIIVVLVIFKGCFPSDKPDESYYEYDARQEQYEAMADQAEEDKGRRDASALSCEMAKDFIGETAQVKGSVENIYYANETSGSPTFIDLDFEYPDERRVTIIIWEENYSNVAEIVDNLSYGDIIFVTGKLEEYNGAVQIEVTDSDQIELE
ncbi:OB-fold nucleic acid binding domain-containing protein [bacterium 210820-DFI.6.37]|nr:OB-fold nucleic acid binding domain-containing protein [bacterium 210820-DFI.6.37]